MEMENNKSRQETVAAITVTYNRTRTLEKCIDALLNQTRPVDHIIIADKNTTGDGIIASLAVLSAMVQHRLSLNELASAVKLFPQVLINVRFAGGDNPLESETVKAVAADVEKRLEGKGRILLRKSGTEPLIRVMVECEDGVLAKQCAEEIAEAVKAN